ncbi:hypothetical protein [Streptococcus sp. DD13]|uniref:hypothetical protein n=1 Tax=Streptococcus sp. DD13 TaxID=1777881 RepID=UPI0007972AD9|nr:hypothetical protein [Streptococcus sp. DD13]KXT77786.1 hypothetical protein STRDD13_01300 [Streptococcus sp. DD13]
MRKYLFLMLLPVLCVPLLTDSLEIEFKLTNQEKYEFTQQAYQFDFQKIPQHPLTIKEIDTFSTADLSKKNGKISAHTSLSIQSIKVNDQGKKIFELKQGSFILADTRNIADDIVQGQRSVDQTFWTKKDIHVYQEPTGGQLKILPNALASYQPVQVSKIVTTVRGEFAFVEGKGYLPLQELSETDNRIELVQSVLEKNIIPHLIPSMSSKLKQDR